MLASRLLGRLSARATNRSGFLKGSGLKKTARARLRTAVLAPIPSASVRMETAAKAGDFRSRRTAWRKSWSMFAE